MPSYFCACCNYTTERKNNYTKHINTKKHNQNFLKSQQNQETSKNPQFSSLQKNKFPHFSSLSKNSSLYPHFQNSQSSLFPHFENSSTKSVIVLEDENTNPTILINNENTIKEPTFSTLNKTNTKLIKNKKEKKEYKCENCNYTTYRSDNFKRHKGSCKKKPIMTVNVVETNHDTNKLLQARIEHLETQRRTEQEHYRSILAEKERYIESLKEHNKHISQTHFNIIQNNIITMNPIKFLNTYCTNNPSLKDVVASINEGNVDKKFLLMLDQAIETENFNMIGDIMHKILQDKNMQLIKQTGQLLGTCPNVLFVNDGSGRRYITKGEPGWDYMSDDTPLDQATIQVLKKVNNIPAIKGVKEHHVGKKNREVITKQIKRRNDWNSQKDTIIGNILGEPNAIEYSIEKENEKKIEVLMIHDTDIVEKEL